MRNQKLKPSIHRQESSLSSVSQHSQSSRQVGKFKDPILENSPIQINVTQIEKHFKVKVNNNKLDVYFPYQPYEVQVKYMESVLQCLENKQHGLLESPTGTGKTLSLLCATLAWLQKRRESTIVDQDSVPNRIIYCSRTHSQIQQAVKELRRTIYQPKVVVQGSREQYCIKKEFEQLKGGILISACQKAINPANVTKYCRYFRGGADDAKDFFKLRIPDIEDFKADGYTNNFCPYFATQRISNAVDVLFLPYNYILDRNIAGQAGINITNAILIFDEAHNIHKVAEEGFSIHINYSTLCAAESDLLTLKKAIDRGYLEDESYSYGKNQTPIKPLSDFDTKNFFSCAFDCEAMVKPIQALKQLFKQKSSQKSENIQVSDGKDIFQLIELHTRSEIDKLPGVQTYQQELQKIKGQNFNSFEKGINLANITLYIEKAALALKDLSMGASHHGLEIWSKFLEGLRDLWQNYATFIANSRQIKRDKSKNPSNNSINTSRSIMFEELMNNHQTQMKDQMEDYKMYFDFEDIDNPKLNVSCLNASLNFKRVLSQKPHCLLFTSGTLKPFDFWSSETQLKFDVILENDHVIQSDKQLLSLVVSKRPTRDYSQQQSLNTFNFSFERRKEQDMLINLGEGLVELFGVIPSGILVVFPSNSFMDVCRQIWSYNYTNNRLYQQMVDIKFIYWEQKSNIDNQSAMNEYKHKSKTDRGSVFFCVARGKITEGIDFSDEYARAVILIGIPYPPIKNISVQVKRQYLDNLSKYNQNEKRLNGNQWYTQEAVRAINQSIGRVIRHISDWGSILLIDERFRNEDLTDQMPKWCHNQFTNSFEEALIKTSQFFVSMKSSILKEKHDKIKQNELKRKQQEEQYKREQVITEGDDDGNNEGDQHPKRKVFQFQAQKQPKKQFKQNPLFETKDKNILLSGFGGKSKSNSLSVNKLSCDEDDEDSDQLIFNQSKSLLTKPQLEPTKTEKSNQKSLSIFPKSQNKFSCMSMFDLKSEIKKKNE